MARLLFAVVAALALSGCASPAWLSNRLVCTVDPVAPRAFVLALVGRTGLSLEIDPADARRACRP